MRRSLFALVCILTILPVTLAAMQEIRGPRLEITGINPTELPTVSVSVNVFDSIGQPAADLTAENFTITGDLADRARIVRVRRFSDEAIPINVVLAIDVSSSMAGTPIESARLAANTFVETIGPQEPVSVLVFSTGSRIVQDYTTDKAALMAAINNLGFGGQTFLYDGALAAVRQAVASSNPRRAVILLSDGAHYDTTGSSRVTAQEAINQAAISGVPVYTIGLGFGIDRSFLQNLSANTNAQFRESPAPDELVAIYTELADLLRTQYEVVLEVDVPFDGTTYDLGLEVNTPEGSASATGRLRAPVPVPIVRLPELPAVIDSVTEVAAEVVADDPLVSVEIALDGTTQTTLTEAPYTFTIDPMALAPGAYSLAFTATDEDGDVGSASVDFTVAALPSSVNVVPPIEGIISNLQVFTLEITGQTPATHVTISQNGGDAVHLVEPYNFVIDPFTLTPGDHLISIAVTNAGGVTTGITSQFYVPELPIQFTLTGIEAGQEISEPTTVSVDIFSSQAPVTAITFTLNGNPLDAVTTDSVLLDPASLPPGPAALAATVENALGQLTTQSISIQIAALAPVVSLSGLELGETLEADRTVQIEVDSQTPVADIAAQVDGQALEVIMGEPASVLLDVLALGPGAHVLSVTVTNQAGLTAQVETAFTIPEGPSLTATAQVTPSFTPTDTPLPTLEASPTETPGDQATVLARAVQMTATAVVLSTEDTRIAQATLTAEAEGQAAGTATSAAVLQAETADAQATVAVQATAAAADETATTDTAAQIAQLTVTARAASDDQATLDAQATTDLIGTVNAQATVDTLATSDAQATADLAATINAQATLEAAEAMTAQAAASEDAVSEQATVDALATQNALATANAVSTATQAALDEQATVDTEATESAALTATQVTLDEEATTVALAAQDVQATESAALTATQAARDSQATADALATENAAMTQTQTARDNQATADALAAENAAMTQTQTALDAQATERAAETQTQAALDSQATENAAMTQTQTALDRQATADAQATVDEEATANAQATASAEPTEEVTEAATEVVPTEAGTAVAQEVTAPGATPTTPGESASPVPTITPIGTLVPAQAETTPANEGLIPIVIIIVVIVVLLLLLYALLSRARRRRR